MTTFTLVVFVYGAVLGAGPTLATVSGFTDLSACNNAGKELQRWRGLENFVEADHSNLKLQYLCVVVK
ncbi:MAG: hypothetical protein WCE69_04780 [Aestuariivirga sp.]